MAEKAKVLLRMEQGMHNSLKIIATNENRSVNNIIVKLLEEYLESKTDEVLTLVFHNIRKKMVNNEELTDLENEYIKDNQVDFMFYIKNSRVMSMDEKISLLQDKVKLPRDINSEEGVEYAALLKYLDK